MKKTLNIDEKLLAEAKAGCGATTDTETVRLGLEALRRHAAYQHLRSFIGSEPNAQDVPRRRPEVSKKRRTR
jgi:putative antitoxin of VapBC-like toxin-antitoxin system